MEISDVRYRQTNRDRDHLQGDRGSARTRNDGYRASSPCRVARCYRVRRELPCTYFCASRALSSSASSVFCCVRFGKKGGRRKISPLNKNANPRTMQETPPTLVEIDVLARSVAEPRQVFFVAFRFKFLDIE